MNTIKDYKLDDLNHAIDELKKVIVAYVEHLAILTNELEYRQNPNPPVQLELF